MCNNRFMFNSFLINFRDICRFPKLILVIESSWKYRKKNWIQTQYLRLAISDIIQMHHVTFFAYVCK